MTADPMDIFDHLVSAHGLSRVHAAGIVGNMAQESGFKTTVLGFDKTGSYGLCQWLGPRKAALMKFAKLHDADPADWRIQTDFVMHELKTVEALAFRRLLSAKTARDAALAFSRYYERPAVKYAHNEKRIAAAEKIFREA